ncbi:DNA cytosine methyltransferase [Ochrobactrum sp. MR28]|nr:DNA cytosine methyltransferase [Ochrobactrum sp. MR28]MBX8818853.1 DNA cytosine methyltransferase [Ochrobactrum sp. MR31]
MSRRIISWFSCGAATVAWQPLGWSPAFFSEIERFPSQVLAHHYGSNMPADGLASNGTPNLGDMTKFKDWPDYAIDLLVGGTPCQSFSVAGLRQGLADPRGNLMLTYLAIARRYQPRWLVWENVPGVLSSNAGRDFGTFIRGLEECGYHAAWRVLDAQYVRVDGFGRAVAQRRRRVFLVGYLGDWRRAAAVLFEREGMSGNSAPSREAREGVAPTISARTKGGGGLGTDFDLDGGLGTDFDLDGGLVQSYGIPGNWIGGAPENGGNAVEPMVELSPCLTKADRHGVVHAAPVAPTLDANYGRLQGHNNQHIDGGAGLFVAGAICSHSFTGGAGGRPEGAAANHFIPIAFDCKASGRNGFSTGVVSPTLRAMGHSNSHPNGGGQVAVANSYAVRRLTPTECERLQGFPDGYTNIASGGKATADSSRYKALGNSMAINCMRWIGRRIDHIEKLYMYNS